MMEIELSRFAIYDGVTVLLLAASSAVRGRVGGEQPTGCILLGVFCSFLWACMREMLLHGSPLLVFSTPLLQAAVFLGAFLGCGIGLSRTGELLAPFLRLLALTLSMSFGLLCALPHTTVSGALFISFFLACLPCIVCDVALGCVASLVDESALYLRAFLGTVVTCAVVCLLPSVAGQDLPSDLISLLCGCLLPLLLQKIFPK